jgi:hypothetical protein
VVACERPYAVKRRASAAAAVAPGATSGTARTAIVHSKPVAPAEPHPVLDSSATVLSVDAAPFDSVVEVDATVPRSVTLPGGALGNSSTATLVDVPRFGAAGVYAALVGAQLCWSGFHVLAKFAFLNVSLCETKGKCRARVCNYDLCAHWRASCFPPARVLVVQMHPMAMPMLRAIGTTPLLFLICCYTEGRDFWRVVSRSDLKILALLGTILCCGTQNLFNIGLQLTTATDGGMSVRTHTTKTKRKADCTACRGARKVSVQRVSISVRVRAWSPCDFASVCPPVCAATRRARLRGLHVHPART